ncbi:sensor of ECF-type sigma factor [Flavobacterium arcticum]|uniref:Sensor of ECF-type sigma factor n=1 Tax=Flavobacterium arcticum TaxID=1784713 RepID=A0A345HCY5_9FLAO|nr:sensor of ECF-type sigma factor [Flavobacterium arcticum]AXG74445.1 sensor of ECF-type sigma factor [Flavobacterium arcticum]KAF2512434.1 sensor of ECF-type sigma factor [Flavobacterium arcticum]
MKTKFLLSLFLLFSYAMHSQGHKEKRAQIKALKVSFITTELSLTSEEAAKFWPIYNVYEDKEFEIKHDKMRKLIKQLDEKGIDKISDKEAMSYLNQLETADEELFHLKQKLVNDLKTIISPIKILKLKKAENDFNRKLLEKYRKKKRE